MMQRILERDRPGRRLPGLHGSEDGALGYGKIGTSDGTRSVAKLVWEDRHGPVPAGMLLRHTCDNPPCIRLDHLILGTSKDNTRDMMLRGRSPRTAFTPDQVRAIRADPRSQEQIAADYGVWQTTISMLKRRQTYAWVDDTT